jgi:ferredoxin--NADP+ reductase
VTAVTHWTDKLFSFQTDRPPSFRFQSGEFAMIGLADTDGKAITRAYSIASPHWDDYLEFYSIIVPDGPLTSRLRHIQIGDDIILRPKTTGTLNLARLRDGKRLYLLATGTGFAPFASLIRDPETYERFDAVILVHGCRTIAELGYSQKIVADSRAHPLIGEMVTAQLHYVPSVTRENLPRLAASPRFWPMASWPAACHCRPLMQILTGL